MRRLILVMIGLVAVAGCSQKGLNSRLQTEARTAEGVDMAVYKTWNFARPDNTASGIALLDDSNFRMRALNSIEKDMAARGLVRVFDETADLKMMMHVFQTDNIDEVAVANQEFDFASMPEGTAYQSGALTLFLFDAKSGKLLWQGNAQAELDPSADDKKRQERFIKVVGDLVAQVPMGGSPVPAPTQ
jgi:Domain of unknown function (DUF4136)